MFLYMIFILEIRLHDISSMTSLLLFLFLSISRKTSFAISSSISQFLMNMIIFSYSSIDLSRYIISFLALNPSSLLNSLRYFSIMLFDFTKFRILLSQIMILSSFHISEKLYSNSSILINDCLYHFTLKSTIKSKE